jgi:hypothetical protein
MTITLRKSFVWVAATVGPLAFVLVETAGRGFP